jgi:hypothetical protein
LTNDNTLIRTRSGITFGPNYKVDIIISEGIEEHFADKPMKINPKRLVSSLSMLVVLMYAFSLSIRPIFKLNIHNQCLNVNLVSPIYVISNGLECHKVPDHNVRAGSMTRSSFIIHKTGNESFGILIYRLQRRQARKPTEIGKGT